MRGKETARRAGLGTPGWGQQNGDSGGPAQVSGPSNGRKGGRWAGARTSGRSSIWGQGSLPQAPVAGSAQPGPGEDEDSQTLRPPSALPTAHSSSWNLPRSPNWWGPTWPTGCRWFSTDTQAAAQPCDSPTPVHTPQPLAATEGDSEPATLHPCPLHTEWAWPLRNVGKALGPSQQRRSEGSMDPWHTLDSHQGLQLTPGEIWGQREIETLRGIQGQKEQVTRREKQREGRPQMQLPWPIPPAPPHQALEPWWGACWA